MATSLLALIDDITSVLDDVAVLSKVAVKKTTGVLGDDLALNAQQVSGVKAERELPVVWAVAKGSFINKAILVPAALAISAFAPWAVTPLLMVGGAFLCFEGFEKLAPTLVASRTVRGLAGRGSRDASPLSPVQTCSSRFGAADSSPSGAELAWGGPALRSPAHKFMHSAQEQVAERETLSKALADPAVDLRAVEKDKIKGAIRTDFILSAEIVAITLGTVQSSPFITQLTVLSGIALAMTVGVYGLVAGIVKLDDGGLYLSQQAGNGAWRGFQRSAGSGILLAAPWLMKGLSVAGTIAMFLVGGGILTHGIPPLDHAIEALAGQAGTLANMGAFLAAVMPLLADALVGVLAGALVLGGVTLIQKALPARRAN